MVDSTFTEKIATFVANYLKISNDKRDIYMPTQFRSPRSK